MDLSLRYVTHFRYATPVWESHNSLRACPREDEHQELLDYRVEVDPEAAVFSYVDSWGTRVDTFDIPQAHDQLIVTAFAKVTTKPRPVPDSGPFGGTADMGYIESEWRFLQPTNHTSWTADVENEAKDAMKALTDVVQIVNSVESRVRERLDYRPGATTIGAQPADVLNQGSGVCQDFAHLTIAMLRSVGIASRYVSGYFYASDPSNAAEDEDEIVVATHAWVEVAVPEWGWWAIDPTNPSPVGERHIKIGHGRDYDDVTPLRGVYYGESDHHLAATVTMSTSPTVSETIPDVTVGADASQQ